MSSDVVIARRIPNRSTEGRKRNVASCRMDTPSSNCAVSVKSQGIYLRVWVNSASESAASGNHSFPRYQVQNWKVQINLELEAKMGPQEARERRSRSCLSTYRANHLTYLTCATHPARRNNGGCSQRLKCKLRKATWVLISCHSIYSSDKSFTYVLGSVKNDKTNAMWAMWVIVVDCHYSREIKKGWPCWSFADSAQRWPGGPSRHGPSF